jgi:hypothetical protein
MTIDHWRGERVHKQVSNAVCGTDAHGDHCDRRNEAESQEPARLLMVADEVAADAGTRGGATPRSAVSRRLPVTSE